MAYPDNITWNTAYGEGEEATVLGVHPNSYTIRIATDDGEVLVGNQWDDV